MSNLRSISPSFPPQASQAQREAHGFTNEQLGLRIQRLADYPRSWDRETRDALLMEAGKRLYWRTNYEAHRGPQLGG